MARDPWRLPGYRVEELIGAGATGEVWRARVASTGVAVALKRITVTDPLLREAAVSEAAILSALDHPHLMKLHDLCRLDDAIVLVLDLAAGGTLASLLDRRGRLTVGETITAIAPIGAALAYTHNAGVVHGDVSAANILFTELGLPLLADLGVARLLGEVAPVRTTLCYADPLVGEGSVPGPAADVFMLGAVALHALTGTPPWTDPAGADRELAAGYGEQPDFAGRLRSAGLPEPVVDVVARALTVEPGARGTAADFALDLRHAGVPVAVELTAGRPRRSSISGSGRDRVESWPLEPVPPRDGGASTGGAPVPFTAEPPITYGARAPLPFTSPPGARHLARRRGRPRIAAGLATVLVAVGLVVGAAAMWWPFGSHESRPRTAVVAGASVHAPTFTPSVRPAQRHQPQAHASRAPTVTEALARLDRLRSRAFAARDPALLERVYSSAELLARDRAMLTAVVPPGCGLDGMHTTFRDVRSSVLGTRVHVRAMTSLSPATLRCGDMIGGRTQPSVATLVSIDLVRDGAGYRIAGSRRVSAADP